MENQFTDDARRWSRLAWAAIVLFAAAPLSHNPRKCFSRSEIREAVRLRSCRAGDVLTGVELWTGDHVDAIKPICIPAVAGQFQEYPTRYGGDGGNGPQQFVCPNDSPVVIGMDIAVESAVNNIHLYCGQAIAAPQRAAFPWPRMTGRRVEAKKLQLDRIGFSGDPTTGMLRCEAGFIAVGIVGRSGKFLDALGMVCGAPPPPPAPAQQTVKAQGRVKLGGAVPPGPARPICEIASEARARNSPAAPGLEAQCAAEERCRRSIWPRCMRGARRSPRSSRWRRRCEANRAKDRRGAALKLGWPRPSGTLCPDPARIESGQNSARPTTGLRHGGGFFTGALQEETGGPRPQGQNDRRQGSPVRGVPRPASRRLRPARFRSRSRRGGRAYRARSRQAENRRGAAAGRTGRIRDRGYILDRTQQQSGPRGEGRGDRKSRPDRRRTAHSEPDALYRLGFDIATGIFGDRSAAPKAKRRRVPDLSAFATA